MEGDHLGLIPNELVTKAQESTEFAVRLLHVETRAEALREAACEATPELDALLTELANMSFREALESLRTENMLQP